MPRRSSWVVITVGLVACGPSLGEGVGLETGDGSTAGDTSGPTLASADGQHDTSGDGTDGTDGESEEGSDSSADETSGSARCGDGAVDLGEDCDDGNPTDEDGCNADCHISGTIEWMATPDGAASLLGFAIVANPEGGVTVATATDDPQMVLTRYTAAGVEDWVALSPSDMVIDALAATTAGQLVWALRSTNGPNVHLLQGFDDTGSLVWTLPESQGISFSGIDAAVGLANTEAAFGGGTPWELRVDTRGAVTFTSTAPSGEQLTGMAPYLQGTLALTTPPTRAYVREDSDPTPTLSIDDLPDAHGGPFGMSDGTFGYLSHDGVDSTIARLDTAGLIEVLVAPGREQSLAATITPTDNLVTMTGPSGDQTVYKWTTDGTILWSAAVPEGMNALVSDSAGAIYVFGTVASADGTDAAILKLRP